MELTNRAGVSLAMAQKASEKGAGGKPAKPEEYTRFEDIIKKIIKGPPLQKKAEKVKSASYSGSIYPAISP